MPKKRAFVRYTKSGEIVPGSLIVTTNGGYPDKTSLWQEVSVDKCCGDLCPEPSQPFCTENWTFENFDGTSFRNGDLIPQVTNDAAWAALTSPAWCYHNNTTSNGSFFGKLYNWYAVNDPRGLAPDGYRISTVTDWENLAKCTAPNNSDSKSEAGGKLKHTGVLTMLESTGIWSSPNIATNDFGFSALPGGFRNSNGSFGGFFNTGNWWTSNEADLNNAFYYSMSNNTTILTALSGSKKMGMSVRLIKDI